MLVELRGFAEGDAGKAIHLAGGGVDVKADAVVTHSPEVCGDHKEVGLMQAAQLFELPNSTGFEIFAVDTDVAGQTEFGHIQRQWLLGERIERYEHLILDDTALRCKVFRGQYIGQRNQTFAGLTGKLGLPDLDIERLGRVDQYDQQSDEDDKPLAEALIHGS